MHDPDTVILHIRWPFFKKKTKLFAYGRLLITVWHKDPCTDGSDDSCDWFGGRKNVGHIVKKIAKDMFMEIDPPEPTSEFNHSMWYRNNDPRYESTGMGVALFHQVAYYYFRALSGSSDKAGKLRDKYMCKQLPWIIWFANNPTDSIHSSLTKPMDYDERVQLIRIILGCVIRDNRKWYQHPKWHIKHWQIQWVFIQDIKKKMFPTRVCRGANVGRSA